MPREWTTEDVLKLASAYQPAAVLHAAADLDLFGMFAGRPFTAEQVAAKLRVDTRGLRTLLDALVALQLLHLNNANYEVPPSVAKALSANSPGNVLAMAQHQSNCARRWVQLAKVVKTDQPADRVPSIRGPEADYESFIEAMDNLSAPIAGQIVASIPVGEFNHLLDVGGASGSWTIAFLRLNPRARATIFDLPQVIPQARSRISAAGFDDRVSFAAGDFYKDPLPGGCDLTWVSAIIHQNSRTQNRELFHKLAAALAPAGRILIRDIVMEESRTAPIIGALFAINMLTGPHAGGTFTLAELREDLESAGFRDIALVRKDEGMHSVVGGRLPKR